MHRVLIPVDVDEGRVAKQVLDHASEIEEAKDA